MNIFVDHQSIKLPQASVRIFFSFLAGTSLTVLAGIASAGDTEIVGPSMAPVAAPKIESTISPAAAQSIEKETHKTSINRDSSQIVGPSMRPIPADDGSEDSSKTSQSTQDKKHKSAK
jgi:hypothetical protein